MCRKGGVFLLEPQIAKKTSVWSKNFILVFIYAVLCQFTMSVSNTVLPLFVIAIGYSNAQSGLLGTVFTIASTICRFAAGGLSDRRGRRQIMILGAFIVGSALLCMGFSTAFGIILVFKFIQGVGHSLNSTASNAAASDVLPKERLGDGIGYYGLHTTFTNAIGPTLALALMGAAIPAAFNRNYQLPLIVGGIGGLAAASIAFAINYERKRTTSSRENFFKLSSFLERRSMMPALLQAFQAVSTGASIFMLVFASSMGFGSISYYYIISAASTLIARLVIGKRMDTVKPVYVVAIPLFVLVGSYFFLAFTLSEASFIFSGVVSGAFNALLVPTFNSLSLKLAPASRSGAASATYWLGFDAGMAVGQIAFGAIIDAGGFYASFLTAGIYLLVFACVAILLLRNLKPICEIQRPSS
jgi:MFS family permease